jgi:ribulose bisphosphate carboxylase small subunit
LGGAAAAAGNVNGNGNGNGNGRLVKGKGGVSVGVGAGGTRSGSTSSSRRASRDEGQPESLSHHLRQLRATMTWRKLLTIIIAFPFWAVMELTPIAREAFAQIPILFQQFRAAIVLKINNIIERIHQRNRRIRKQIVALLKKGKEIALRRVEQARLVALSWYNWLVSLYIKYVREPFGRVRAAIVQRVNAIVTWVRSTLTSIRKYITKTIE